MIESGVSVGGLRGRRCNEFWLGVLDEFEHRRGAAKLALDDTLRLVNVKVCSAFWTTKVS